MLKRLSLLALLFATPAFAQWQTPTNTIPVGRGPGVIGFNTVGGSGGGGSNCLKDTVPPTFALCNAGVGPADIFAYGARTTGTAADNQTAINAAIASGNAAIYIPSGSFCTTGTTVPSTVNYIFGPGELKLCGATANSTLRIASHPGPLLIEGTTISAANTYTANAAIDCALSANLRITDLTIAHGGIVGIQGFSCTNVVLTNVRIQDWNSQGRAVNFTSSTAEMNNVNIFHTNAATCVAAVNCIVAVELTTAVVQLHGGTYDLNGADSFGIQFDASTGGAYAGLICKNSRRECITSNNSTGLQIDSVVVKYDGGGTYTDFGMSFGAVTDFSLTNSTVIGAGSSCVSLNSGTLRAKIIGNTFVDCGRNASNTAGPTSNGLTITNITKANPAVVTVSAVGLANSGIINTGSIYISGVGGMTQVNGNRYTVSNFSGTTFNINTDSTAFGAYTAGGTGLIPVHANGIEMWSDTVQTTILNNQINNSSISNVTEFCVRELTVGESGGGTSNPSQTHSGGNRCLNMNAGTDRFVSTDSIDEPWQYKQEDFLLHTNSPLASFDLRQALSLSGTISPVLAADVNDWAPTGVANAIAIRTDGGVVNRNITGLLAATEGRIFTILNIGTTNNLVLKNSSGSSSAANRFLLAADVTIPPSSSFTIRYDATTARWRPWTDVASCSTCVTSAAALTANSLMIGAGGQASAVTATGTGILTALGNNIGSAGAPITFNGALGTPSSGTLTSTTGLPISTGLTGTGTGVLTALGVNVGTAGSVVVNGGALGSPSSVGTLPAHTLGGTIAGGGNQINNVVIGASTPLAGSFTTLTGTSGTHTGITSLGIRDTSAAFDVTLAAVSSSALTAGRTLTLDLVNAARTLKLGSNLTLASDPGAVTGALKSNGTGTFAQAACADLSNGTTNCSAAVGQLPGTTTNDDAAAGKVGEYIASNVASASVVSLVSVTAKSIGTASSCSTSASNTTAGCITLSAGDWDIRSSAYYVTGTGTNVVDYRSSISTTTNTENLTGGFFAAFEFQAGGVVPQNSGTISSTVPPVRVSISGSTTYYLVAFSQFSVSTMSAYGSISARRVR